MDILNNLRPSPVDSRDKIVQTVVSSDILPLSVDLKPHVFEVESQGTFGTCTANAACSSLELLYNYKKTPVDLSRMFLYYYSRLLGNLKGDVGAYPRDVCKALHKYGTCYEKNWQYIKENLELEPDEKRKKEAEQFKIISYESIVNNKLNTIKSMLANNTPILLTIQVHDQFNSLGKNWKEHDWDTVTTDTNKLVGWHEVLIIGYDDVSKRLLVENSWGPFWADGGFFGIPYEKIDTEFFGELWVLTPNYDFQWDSNMLEVSKKTNFVKSALLMLVVALTIYMLMFYKI